MNAKTERKDKRNFKKMEGERDFDIVVCRNDLVPMAEETNGFW